jgi:hypothetical protein
LPFEGRAYDTGLYLKFNGRLGFTLLSTA